MTVTMAYPWSLLVLLAGQYFADAAAWLDGGKLARREKRRSLDTGSSSSKAHLTVLHNGELSSASTWQAGYSEALGAQRDVRVASVNGLAEVEEVYPVKQDAEPEFTEVGDARLVSGIWTRHGDKEYLVDTTQQRVEDEASAYCAAMGGHTVTIHSEQEQQLIEAILPNDAGIRRNNAMSYWIGLKGTCGDPPFAWDDGSPYDYTAWDDGQPNGACTHCVRAQYEDHDGRFRWDDAPCNMNHGNDIEYAFCQRDFKAKCDTMTKCPVGHIRKADASTLECAGATCDETVDADQCCEAWLDPNQLDPDDCISKRHCVSTLFAHFTSIELVEFECECNEHYKEYKETGVWPEATEDMCKQFVSCLNDQNDLGVKVLTGVAMALANTIQPSLIENDPGQDPQSCFNPSPAKYKELTECDCLFGLVKACGDDAGMEAADECLKSYACTHDKVCNDWQQVNCAEISSPGSGLQLRAHAGNSTPGAREGSAALETSARRLDETLQTKCA
jgi:hypothetical protein